ncbi:isoleucine--tRNA ligase [Chitinivibrio alkaliphilus]|uniref:Isoleucine--tRNA ligase n=1 Tax=Chitinivibrio alkaliphilus ACht1 TaxID=1313304 RepID=U7DAL4_9BACT|nr:isoleucine--tRNA ligase [Chitinivibrio alkaliphilus]ERP39072.1 isoleucyl-tRNA synthetase [Chitinivibrio alkaliphilus ACht1]
MAQGYFKAVDTKVNFPRVEEKILATWKKNKTFQKSLEKTRQNETEDFVFYDGPPFATGLPHYGHLLAGTIKDIVPRYWTMRGHHVDRRFGWDTHGLPVENEMEKEFQVSGKKEIDDMGLHLFNEACRSIVLRYTSQWQEVVERMGRWVDFDNQYRTMDAPYMESIWWVFKEIWGKGLIYEGFRVQPYCPRCTTPLSNFEVNEGYQDKKDISITVKMPVKGQENTSILVWTTTPWTLPSNVALAVGPDIPYVKVQDGDEFFILAEARLSAYYKNESDYTVVETYTGRDLTGLSYTPMFPYFAERSEKFFQVHTADFVSTEDGTGIVHIAPAFGEDDFLVGKELGLPIVCPVDEEGRYTEEVCDYAGQFVHDANVQIVADIKETGRLVHKQTITHRYPFCYRCDTPLIYKAINTWFMQIEPLKPNMHENNSRIHWVPGHLQKGRFGKGIEGAPDWNIARNRYWGTPIPLWRCECGHIECVGSLKDLHVRAGKGNEEAGKTAHKEVVSRIKKALRDKAQSQLEKFNIDPAWAEAVGSTEISENDLHSHIVNALTLSCPECENAMERTPEVLDCWFESGSMPYAQNHYPFENKEYFEKNFPANFIAEGIDQTRGWFYTLTVLSSALFGREAFQNVIVNGIILAEDGNKMSKRLKNYAPPQEIMDKVGADAIRLFLINSPAVKAENLRFSEEGVREMARSILIPFWNAYSFFVTYANIDSWKPTSTEAPASDNELDRWVISLLAYVIRDVNREMEEYNLYKVVPLMVDFIDNLTNWYIRRSRRRFWKSQNDGDKENAYQTLYHVLVEFSKVMAPFLPFLTDAVYENLVCGTTPDAPESVHLCDFPRTQEKQVDEDIITQMALVRNAVGIGRLLRSRYGIKNRQPLSDITVIIRDAHKRHLVADMKHLIMDELNVKDVRLEEREESVLHISAKPNFKKLGPIFGKEMKKVGPEITAFTPEDITDLEAGATRSVLGRDITFEDILLVRNKKEGVEVETDGEVTLALNTEITESLAREGLVRELINRIQNHRKESGYEVSDRITLTLSCPAPLRDAMGDFMEIIQSETLTEKLTFDDAREARETCTVEEYSVGITSQKA